MNSKLIQKPSYSEYNLVSEKEKIIAFLAAQNIAVSPDFIDTIEVGDIVEIYSFPENKQIYSNSEFKKLCSYSAEQMETIPFPKLFWREESFHNQLMKRASDICALKKQNYSWDLTNHELIESLHPRKRTFDIKMKNIAPCFAQGKVQSVAWASTLQVELIFEWENFIS